MDLLKYRNKSDGYLKRIDDDFPKSLSRPPFQRKKHYYALKDVYPYVAKINEIYGRKEQKKSEAARAELDKIRTGQPRMILMMLRRISNVHENFKELEDMLVSLNLPARKRSKCRDICMNAIKNYMRRQSVCGRLKVVQSIMNWIEHEENQKKLAER
ncbi:hypothetical protein ID007_004333 [Salmonella enterica]|nr:hypothetical protein [Salmonella enterica]